jgi:hypothetical protein
VRWVGIGLQEHNIAMGKALHNASNLGQSSPIPVGAQGIEGSPPPARQARGSARSQGKRACALGLPADQRAPSPPGRLPKQPRVSPSTALVSSSGTTAPSRCSRNTSSTPQLGQGPAVPAAGANCNADSRPPRPALHTAPAPTNPPHPQPLFPSLHHPQRPPCTCRSSPTNCVCSGTGRPSTSPGCLENSQQETVAPRTQQNVAGEGERIDELTPTRADLVRQFVSMGVERGFALEALNANNFDADAAQEWLSMQHTSKEVAGECAGSVAVELECTRLRAAHVRASRFPVWLARWYEQCNVEAETKRTIVVELMPFFGVWRRNSD